MFRCLILSLVAHVALVLALVVMAILAPPRPDIPKNKPIQVHFVPIQPQTTPAPEATPVATPKATPEPTPAPTPEPTPKPTPKPTPEPTPKVTPKPTPKPTPEPVKTPVPKKTVVDPKQTPLPKEPEVKKPVPDKKEVLVKKTVLDEEPEPTPAPTPEPTTEPTPVPTPYMTPVVPPPRAELPKKNEVKSEISTMESTTAEDFSKTYFLIAQSLIERNFKHPLAKSDLICRIKFTVLRDGTITNIQLLQSTGNATIDQYAMNALLQTRKLPELWEGYSKNLLEITITFNYERRP